MKNLEKLASCFDNHEEYDGKYYFNFDNYKKDAAKSEVKNILDSINFNAVSTQREKEYLEKELAAKIFFYGKANPDINYAGYNSIPASKLTREYTEHFIKKHPDIFAKELKEATEEGQEYAVYYFIMDAPAFEKELPEYLIEKYGKTYDAFIYLPNGINC